MSDAWENFSMFEMNIFLYEAVESIIWNNLGIQSFRLLETSAYTLSSFWIYWIWRSKDIGWSSEISPRHFVIYLWIFLLCLCGLKFYLLNLKLRWKVYVQWKTSVLIFEFWDRCFRVRVLSVQNRIFTVQADQKTVKCSRPSVCL